MGCLVPPPIPLRLGAGAASQVVHRLAAAPACGLRSPLTS